MKIMGKKITLLGLTPLVLTVSVVSLFFAITDPASWPQRRILLSASDTLLVSPSESTVWCEALVLNSDHDYVAYKTHGIPDVGSKLSRNLVNINTNLNRRKYNTLELKYYMLPGSVITVLACSSDPGVSVQIYRGIVNGKCLSSGRRKLLASSEYDSDESDEEDTWIPDETWEEIKKDKCPTPLRSEELPVYYSDEEAKDCSIAQPISFNIHDEDNYVIVFTNDNGSSNRLKLKLSLERTSYNVNKSKESIHMCGSHSSCVVPLTFISSDTVLLWVPPEPDAGRSLFAVYSRCRPRIAVFAVFIVLLPVMLSLLVVFVVVRDKKRAIMELQERVFSRNYATPLLVTSSNQDSATQWENNSPEPVVVPERRGSDPPSYEVIFTEPPPPPYSSLKVETEPK